MRDDLAYWLLSEEEPALEWRANAPGRELARALVEYKESKRMDKTLDEQARLLLEADPAYDGAPDAIETELRNFQTYTEKGKEMAVDKVRSRLTALWQQELASAEAELSEADVIEAEASEEPTRWLTRNQLQEASERERFIVENLERAAGEELVNKIVHTVRSRDKVAGWIMLRHLPEVLADVPAKVREDYHNALVGLRWLVMPDKVLSAPKRAHEQRLAAEKRRVAAKAKLWKINGQQGQFNPYQ